MDLRQANTEAGETHLTNQRFDVDREQPQLFVTHPEAQALIPVQADFARSRLRLCRLTAFDRREREVADLKLRGRQGIDGAGFTQTGNKEAFAIVNLREDMQEAFRRGRMTGRVEEGVQRQKLDGIRIALLEPQADVLVFIAIQRAGRVNQRPAWAQGMKRAVDQFALCGGDLQVAFNGPVF